MKRFEAMADSTPVIVSVGEFSEKAGDEGYMFRSPVALATMAAKAALADTGVTRPLALEIDVVAGIRQAEVSAPDAVAPFGCSNNFPRSVAKLIGADPARAVLEAVGGDGPQHLVNEFAAEITAGRANLVLLVGAEALSSMRGMLSAGESADWSESVSGSLEDRGYGPTFMDEAFARVTSATPLNVFALLENARRAKLGLGRAEYGLEMGRLFAPFTTIAAKNPHAFAPTVKSAAQLAEVSDRNRLTADPFPQAMVARNYVNQSAAVLMTSLAKARELGINPSRMVFLHGRTDATDHQVQDRPDLSSSPASVLAVSRAIEMSGLTLDAIDHLDLYSCFPVAVFNICDGLGIAATDTRALTVTGGLPFFGGPGNNYSMHAIAGIVRAARASPGSYGLVGANGGYLSKYSVGIYSTNVPDRLYPDNTDLAIEVGALPKVASDQTPDGIGVVETYTIDHTVKPAKGIIVGRAESSGVRFIAGTTDIGTVNGMISHDPIGADVVVASDAETGPTIVSLSLK